MNDQCPHCDALETFQHLLRCQSPAAVACRSTITTAITTICIRRRAPDIIRSTLQTWFAAWLQYEIPDRGTTDPRLHLLYDAQTKIGWDLMIRGFFATEWTNITPAFQPHWPKPYNHDMLFPKLIADLWSHQLEFWTAHQAARHATQETNQQNLTDAHQELQSQVRHLFSMADNVLPSQRDKLFATDLEEFLHTHTSTQLRNYIDTYTPAIRLSIRQAKRQARARTRSLTTYGFVPTPPEQTPLDPLNNTNIPDPLQPAATYNLPDTVVEIQPTTQTREHRQPRIIEWVRTRLRPPPTTPQTPRPTTTLAPSVATLSSTQHSTDIPTSTTSPNTATRAPHHKHSRWRSIDLQRQRFLNFFRR